MQRMPWPLPYVIQTRSPGRSRASPRSGLPKDGRSEGRPGAGAEWEQMIASVSGTVQSRRPDHVVIDCAGVGYRLSVSSKTLERVPATGQSVVLLAHLILRDDGIQLYGFAVET